MIDTNFWKGKRVFLTGHTGFKGAWLSLWLHSLSAEVVGYALNPPTDPSLYYLCGIDKLITSIISDVRDGESLKQAMLKAQPEIVIHMAAQPLVRNSYEVPAETYAVNVMGSVHLLDAVRTCKSVKTVINVTTDKCYENKEWAWGYRENDDLGGYDPYSNSKACSELVTSAYRNSFFNPRDYAAHGVGIASARAGNVIGGGDWAADRLIPDCMRALLRGEDIVIRNPLSIRPWQHVLEPLSGYLMLSQKLYEDGMLFSQAWNFGPDHTAEKTVEWVIRNICTKWPGNASYVIQPDNHKHEARYLKLDCSKTRALLGWKPVWKLGKAIDCIIQWTLAYKDAKDMSAVCFQQIYEYCQDAIEV